jgi:hypothetical protein
MNTLITNPSPADCAKLISPICGKVGYMVNKEKVEGILRNLEQYTSPSPFTLSL